MSSEIYYSPCPIEILKGNILSAIEVDLVTNEILFKTLYGQTFIMYHEQGCFEEVVIEDICGDLDNLLFEPIFVAEERTSESEAKADIENSATCTFYELATIKGSVTIRWYGESNGYYSETADFAQIKLKD